MADTLLRSMAQNIAPLGSDKFYLLDDPNGTPADNGIYLGDVNLLPDGYLINGKISVTVASNNITVALKTKSGGNPSATDPVTVWVNGSFRRCTASLSVTRNAGTNWMNAGSAELATKEIDWFVYLIWNTTPATDILDIGFARFPFGRVYSDFNATGTNEKSLAFGNASTPAATDEVCVIGRFAATLSASASYNWSVPTFTNTNLIQFPIYETRELSYTPAWASTGTAPAIGNGTLTGTYQIIGRKIEVEITQTQGGTTTFGTGFYNWTLPFTLSTYQTMPCNALDSGTAYYVGASYDYGANNLAYVITSGGATPWGQTVPITWAASDVMNIRAGGRI